MHFSLTDLVLRDQNGVVKIRRRSQAPCSRLVENDISTATCLFGSGVITFITLLLVRVADQDTLLGFSV